MIIIACVGLLMPMGSARADDASTNEERARALGKQGGAAGQAGDFNKAIELFKRARALDDRAEYQCSIAVAYYAQKNFPSAHLFFSQCFARSSSIDAGKLDKVRGVFAAVSKALRSGDYAAVEILTEPAGALVGVSHFAKDELIPAPVSLWLPFGEHTLTVTAPGYWPRTARLALSSKTRHLVKVTLDKPAPALELPARTGAGTGVGVGEPTAQPLASQSVERRVRRPKRRAAWVTLSVAAVALAGAGTFHFLAAGSRDDLASMYPVSARDAKEASFERQRLAAIGLYAAGGVAAGIGTYLLFRSQSRPGVALGASTSPNSGAMWVTWTH